MIVDAPLGKSGYDEIDPLKSNHLYDLYTHDENGTTALLAAATGSHHIALHINLYE